MWTDNNFTHTYCTFISVSFHSLSTDHLYQQQRDALIGSTVLGSAPIPWQVVHHDWRSPLNLFKYNYKILSPPSVSSFIHLFLTGGSTGSCCDTTELCNETHHNTTWEFPVHLDWSAASLSLNTTSDVGSVRSCKYLEQLISTEQLVYELQPVFI